MNRLKWAEEVMMKKQSTGSTNLSLKSSNVNVKDWVTHNPRNKVQLFVAIGTYGNTPNFSFQWFSNFRLH